MTGEIMILNYTVKKQDENMSIKDIMSKRLYLSKILIYEIIGEKMYYLNDKTTFTNTKVKENDILKVILPKEKTAFKNKFKLVDTPLDILFEDDYLLIINKPANMPVHPSANNYDNTLSNIVAAYLEKQDIHSIHILTRLDKNTTGICIFAKNKYIQELFVRKKEEINLKKIYICAVRGIIKKSGIINKNITRKENTIILRKVSNDPTVGDFAKTEYFPLKINEDKNYTLLKVLLHTGRTHQIRVHMSYILHPLLGDELYSKEYDFSLSNEEIFRYIKRPALHCYNITLNHPITHKKIDIKSKIPEDIDMLFNM